ncbi:MAG TPA: 4Fe-4S double cluster binding domain-containing protein [Syntrophales bacterium]|nr:4Fe-4S double cluster binding domain-containing protein [Syntrophales bacterium]HQN77977.1 4Fe-4S double cluster binding domain-containing protein [Syntrophales bacterium]
MGGSIREDIVKFLREGGADLAGFASPETWDSRGEVAPEHRPGFLWPPVATVITFGIQMPLPIVETTPSVQHRDLYNTCNRLLDDLAFRLALRLNRQGHASVPISRDGYSRVDVLLRKPGAVFAHTYAAHYSGLGHVGINNTILTREFGPRVRFTSVFTALKLQPDPPAGENLCIRCGACFDLCPVSALVMSRQELKDKGKVLAHYDGKRCALWAKALSAKGCYPCGICVKVCPVGEDRVLYGREKTASHYRKELAGIFSGSDDPLYRAWTVIRHYGGSLTGDGPSAAGGLKEFFTETARSIKEGTHEREK